MALALRNLQERIARYGILEHFEQSLVRFQPHFGYCLAVMTGPGGGERLAAA